MKRLQIKSREYQSLEKEFEEWLQTLGYAEKTVKSLPIYIRELFYYLEQQDKPHISEANSYDIEQFFNQWKRRKNLTTGAGLSSSHINKGILSINKFLAFLKLTQKHNIEVELKREEPRYKPITVLSLQEIQSLYEATFSETRAKSSLPFNQRDRAILGIFYGCGLRLNEGINLDTEDVLIEKKLVFVKKGKGGKQRYVPFTEQNLEYITEYIFDSRKWFTEERKKTSSINTKSLFVNVCGKRMKSNGFYSRIKYLQEQCTNANLRDKRINLHSLRHSIATHLLKSGMTIENVGKFLGHSTLESTQIYTHIINEL